MAMAMKFSALILNLIGIMMQVLEQKHSVSVLRYDLYLELQGVICAHMRGFARPIHKYHSYS